MTETITCFSKASQSGIKISYN